MVAASEPDDAIEAAVSAHRVMRAGRAVVAARSVGHGGFIALGEARDAGIVPHIGTLPSGLAEFQAVDVGSHSYFVDEHQIMLRALEALQAAIGLVPHAQVLER